MGRAWPIGELHGHYCSNNAPLAVQTRFHRVFEVQLSTLPRPCAPANRQAREDDEQDADRGDSSLCGARILEIHVYGHLSQVSKYTGQCHDHHRVQNDDDREEDGEDSTLSAGR